MGKPGKTHAFLSPVWESMVKHTLSHPRVRETMVKHMLSHAQAVEIHSVSIGTSGILPGPHQHPSRITQMLKESDGFYAGFQIERDLFWMRQGRMPTRHVPVRRGRFSRQTIRSLLLSAGKLGETPAFLPLSTSMGEHMLKHMPSHASAMETHCVSIGVSQCGKAR